MIMVSDDNQHWKKTDDFYFGNLINDPTKRYHRFLRPQEARYVRIDLVEAADGSDRVSIAELDLF